MVFGFAMLDFVLGVCFVVSFLKTAPPAQP
jgi:hypothetical protein